MIKEKNELCFFACIEVRINGDFVTFCDGLVSVTEEIDEMGILFLTRILKSHARGEITDLAAVKKIFSFDSLSEEELNELHNHIKHN